MAILAIRLVGGGPLYPGMVSIWKYPEVAKLPAPSQCDVCEIALAVTPAAEQLRTCIPTLRPKLMPPG
eukprot:1193152-Pyramimonas_sp.AAC.1